MVKNYVVSVLIAGTILSTAPYVFAQTPTGEDADIAEGQQVYQQIADKTLVCGQVTDDQFDKVGDYVMQQIMGSAHDAMDQAMTQRFGDAGGKNMHIAMGQRATGCAVTAQNAAGYGMMGNAGMMGWSQPAFSNPSGGPSLLRGALELLAAAFLISGTIYFLRGISRKK